MIILAPIFVFGGGVSDLRGQDGPAAAPSVLHMQHSATTSTASTAPTGFPQFVFRHQLQNGVNSALQMRGLSGTLALQNQTPFFSEALWLLAYYQGQCPPASDQALDGVTGFIWSDIMKNPAEGDTIARVDIRFPSPVPMTGCIALIVGGGPLLVEGAVTMTANLNLAYEPLSQDASGNGTVDVGGEYCFGQDMGCQNSVTDTTQGFAVPFGLPAGHLVELFGSISDSTFDGTADYGPLPTGESWGAVNDFYLLPGGCGPFGNNLNSQGFPNPQPLETLFGWLPSDAIHLDSVPFEHRIPRDEPATATLQRQVQKFFSNPIPVNAGDCLLVIYGRNGNGATDNETQVKVLLTP